jgi:hypothetical protein
MHDGQYFLPSELVAMVAFLFAPPLVLAVVGQTVLFTVRGLFQRRHLARVLTAYIATALGGLIVGVAIHEFAPRWLNAALRVRDVPLSGSAWPVMPLAFVAVGVAAIAAAWWVLSYAHAEP